MKHVSYKDGVGFVAHLTTGQVQMRTHGLRRRFCDSTTGKQEAAGLTGKRPTVALPDEGQRIRISLSGERPGVLPSMSALCCGVLLFHAEEQR